MFFGVSTLIFENSVDISKNEINCIKNSGFDFIEISSFHCVSPEMLAYIKNLGMKISSIHSNFLQTNLSSLDEVSRSGSLQILKSNILTAKSLGADIVVVHPGGWSIDKSSLNAKINNVISSFAEIANFANLNDVRVAIENLPPEFMCDCIEDMHRVLNGVRRIIRDRDSIGICLDTGHANLSNMLPEYISAFGKDIITMHMHDNEGYKGGNRAKAEDDMHNIPGSGSIDWKDVYKNLYKNGYGNMLILELTASHKSEKNIEKILTKAREFLDKL
jgi:sugar phosphate isomerase/epimerase